MSRAATAVEAGVSLNVTAAGFGERPLYAPLRDSVGRLTLSRCCRVRAEVAVQVREDLPRGVRHLSGGVPRGQRPRATARARDAVDDAVFTEY